MTSRDVLRQHAKTFFWAWLLLPAKARGPVADLYAFCREVDDVADLGGADALAKLDDLRASLIAGTEPRAAHFEALGIERRWLIDLVDGARGDLAFTRPATEGDLDVYCYRVAGVVGLMMCPLLGVTDRAAWQHAVDLGSAMQLTNIARDVAEDLQIGRIYVPREWGPIKGQVERSVKRLLLKAESLYASGLLGLRFLPWRTRWSIALAARMYRAIGPALARQEHDPFRGRAFVGVWRKLGLTLGLPWRPRPELPQVIAHNRSWIMANSNRGDERAVIDSDPGRIDLGR